MNGWMNEWLLLHSPQSPRSSWSQQHGLTGMGRYIGSQLPRDHGSLSLTHSSPLDSPQYSLWSNYSTGKSLASVNNDITNVTPNGLFLGFIVGDLSELLTLVGTSSSENITFCWLLQQYYCSLPASLTVPSLAPLLDTHSLFLITHP